MRRTLWTGLIALLVSTSGVWAQSGEAPVIEAAAPPAEETAAAAVRADEEGEVDGAEEVEEEEDERTSFDVKIGDQGRAQGKAGAFDYQDGRYLIATGGVEIVHRDLKITADRVRIDLPNNLLTAEGDLVFDEGPRRLSGDTLEYDLNTRTGRLTNAKAFVAPDFYFTGEEIAKVGPEIYAITDGAFTACSGEVPSWSIHLSDATVTVGEYARIKNARLKLKRLPVFYVPYMVWPARTERTSGFLVPKPGYSRRRGAYLGMAYYQTLGRSADATYYADLYSKEFFGFGTEVRYRPSEVSAGILQAYVISEPSDINLEDFQPILDPDRLAALNDPLIEPDRTRWKFKYFHQTDDLWGGFRGVVSVEEYSDFDFQRDYERSVSRVTRPFIYSNAYLSRNFGQHSVNVMVDRRERIASRTPRDERLQLPEMEYRLRPTRLGNSQLYLSLESSAHFFSIDLGAEEDGGFQVEYGRADVSPTLSIPLSTLSWLSAKLDLGGRATFYTKSLEDPDDPDTTDDDDLDGSLSRFFPALGLQLVGPSFSRIFDTGEDGRFSKFKHVIEPRLLYGFVDDFEDQDRILVFDEIDRLQPGNGILFSVINRLLAKPSDESEGGAYEIASLEVSQGYSFDDTQPGQRSRIDPLLNTRETPIGATLRVNPSQDASLKTDLVYNTLFNDIESFAFSGGKKFSRFALGLTWRTRWNLEAAEGQDDKTSDQMQLFSSFTLLPDRLTFDAAVTYDLRQSLALEQRFFIRWVKPCYSLDFELRESNFRQIEDRDFRFSFTLKHVGTFIELTGGLDSGT